MNDGGPKIDDMLSSDPVQICEISNTLPSYPPYFRASNYYNDTVLDNGSTAGNFSSNEVYDTGFVGLINQAMTCYLNSLLQTLFMTPEFRNAIYRWQYKPALQLTGVLSSEQISASKKNIPYQLQKLFLQMQTSNKKCLHTQDLTQSFGWGSDDAFQQHDVQELCRVMFDALEKMFKGTEQENLITELYQGKLKDYVKCVECSTESARVDVYLDIQLSIKSYIDEYNYNLYDSVEKALSAYIEPEILDGNNKYYCEKCKKLCKAHKGIIFEQFPYILCLQLKRFDFDYKTMMRIKLNNKVTFPETLDIRPYLDESTLNKPDLKTDYELFSIMIHSGSATGGHYYAYVKDFLTNEWYNFNDERVSRLDPNDIQKAYGVSYSSFSSTTAYMLLYRQIDPKRNELFIVKDEYPPHIYDLLKREQEELEEAEKLKEYLENLCKIKVTLVNTNQIECFKPNETLFIEKQCNLHKDLTLEQAKYELAKEFNVTRSDEEFIKRRTRLVKYDVYNEYIEQSFDDESITVYEAMNRTKQVYGYSWIFEVNNVDGEEFAVYKIGSISIKFTAINSNLFHTTDLFTLRVDNDITAMELLVYVNSRLKIVNDNDDDYYDEIKERIHLALERQHAFSPYVYLNEQLTKSLNSLGFLKSNKVFIEYHQATTSEGIKEKCFNKNKFFHILQTITNLIPLTCYLPTVEQCSIYNHKLVRRHGLFDKKKILNSLLTNNNENINKYANENLATYDEVMTARGSSMNATKTTLITSDSTLYPSNNNISSEDFVDTSSSSGYNKRRNAFIDNNDPIKITGNGEEDDELDFGNLTNKILKQKLSSNDKAFTEEETSSNGMLKRRFSDELSKSVDNIQLKTTKRSDVDDEMSVSSPMAAAINEVLAFPSSPSSSSTVNLKDVEIDATNQQQQLAPQFYRYQSNQQNNQHIIDMETSLDEGIGSGSSPNHIKNSPNSLDNLHGSPDTNINEIDDFDSAAAMSSNSGNKYEGPNAFDCIGCSNVDVVGDNEDDDIDAVDNLSTNNDHYGPFSQNVNTNNIDTECWDAEAELDNLNKNIAHNNKSVLNNSKQQGKQQKAFSKVKFSFTFFYFIL